MRLLVLNLASAEYVSNTLWFTFSRQPIAWSFHVVVLQRTAKKCTKNYNAAQLLFCSLKILFGDVLVLVAVVVMFCAKVPTIKYPG